MTTSTLKVHYLEHSRAFRIVWALEELGLAYDIEYYHRNKDGLATAELKNAHPLAISPVLEYDGKILAESGAILNFLQRRYDTENQFRATTEEAMVEYDFWDHYAEGTLMPLVVFNLATDKLDSDQVPTMIRMMTKKVKEKMQDTYSNPRLATQIKYIDDHLTSQKFCAGQKFSFADIQMGWALLAMKKLGYMPQNINTSSISSYLSELTSRTAFINACQRCPDMSEMFVKQP